MTMDFLTKKLNGQDLCFLHIAEKEKYTAYTFFVFAREDTHKNMIIGKKYISWGKGCFFVRLKMEMSCDMESRMIFLGV